jgi:hypothetical protein
VGYRREEDERGYGLKRSNVVRRASGAGSADIAPAQSAGTKENHVTGQTEKFDPVDAT